MANRISVLIVEDCANDAELVVQELHRHGFDPQFERVDRLADMKRALEQRPWDVVISDYSIREFNGMAALDLFNQYRFDIPFICVSGTIGEETAVNVMKAGAHDYVLKDKLSRLGPAIRRELKAAEERRKNRRAESAAAHLAAIVAGSHDAIISKDMKGIVLSWNRAAEDIYGFTAGEMIGESVLKIFPDDHAQEMQEILDKISSGDSIERFETLRRCKDGRNIDVSLTVSPIRDAGGRIVGASTIARDITQSKQQEAERLKLIEELRQAVAQVQTLSGLLPICAWCKKIRDDSGYWQQVETYIKLHTHVDFTHSICPDCRKQVYPEQAPAK
jgi:two-component system, cell cycle sensor histidine kinase and response regulator CckA